MYSVPNYDKVQTQFAFYYCLVQSVFVTVIFLRTILCAQGTRLNIFLWNYIMIILCLLIVRPILPEVAPKVQSVCLAFLRLSHQKHAITFGTAPRTPACLQVSKTTSSTHVHPHSLIRSIPWTCWRLCRQILHSIHHSIKVQYTSMQPCLRRMPVDWRNSWRLVCHEPKQVAKFHGGGPKLNNKISLRHF